MTLQELLEHAHLDALGQLDEREQAAFEAAFAVAPPSVKEQIRREQERWAPMEHLLPQVEPSPELRERVLDAVTAAMVTQAAGELPMRPSRRVAAAWRTASIGLMTAVLVLGAAFVYAYDTERQSLDRARADLTGEFTVQAFHGDVVAAMTSLGTQRTMFALQPGQTAKTAGVGMAWTNPDWKHTHLFFEEPKSVAGQEYRLVVLNANNTLGKPLAHFTSNGVLMACEIDKQPVETRLALVSSVVGKADEILMTVTL
jgi:hypothetical protein